MTWHLGPISVITGWSVIRQSCYMFLLLPSFPIALAYWRVHNSYVKYDHVKLNATHIPTWSDVSSYMNAECLWLIAIIILPHNHFLFKIYFMMREQRRSHHNFPLCLRQSPFIETARGWRAIKLPYILIHLLGGISCRKSAEKSCLILV